VLIDWYNFFSQVCVGILHNPSKIGSPTVDINGVQFPCEFAMLFHIKKIIKH